MLSKKEMKTLIDEIVKSGNELRCYFDAEDDLAVPNPPPSQEIANAFEEKFRGKIPPSYSQLFSIYNGVKNFEWLDVSLLSMEYLMEHDNLDKDWVAAGAFKKGELFIFAQSNYDAHVVAFLTQSADSEGEMSVVHFDAAGKLSEHRDLEGYLRDRLKWFEAQVASERADRKNFSDYD